MLIKKVYVLKGGGGVWFKFKFSIFVESCGEFGKL